jgi:membrane protein YqaA with SNARE-associated domain
MDEFYPLIENYGYLIVFFGVVLGTMGIPFPSAAILIVSGVLVQQGHLGLRSAIVFGVLGAIVGNQIGYWVGYQAGRPFAWSGWNDSSRATAAMPSSLPVSSRSPACSKRWWQARAACTGARLSSTASSAGRCGLRRSGWRRASTSSTNG